MRVLATIAELIGERPSWAGLHDVGLVPTMGFLHAGHLSLFRQARTENGVVVASIFVNPTQFGPGEDLSRYPRDLPHDLERLEAAGVDVVFTPLAEEIYPRGFSTYVEPTGPLATRLEAATRPGHFRGVATVVLKLFQIVQPHQAYFGQKDAQQVAVVRRMVADLNQQVALRILPTIREADGLAMSSRNSYLGPEDRKAATVLYRALHAGYQMLDQAPLDGGNAVARAMAEIIAEEPRATLDYAEVCDPNTFEPLTKLRGVALLAVAARVGPARLIDNFVRRPDGSWDTGVRLP
ncbi:MAG TPA: pantoate--beta-alanine ligase [Ktedonobacterales bacterium]|nr:pantoate--beta-alanine ligase [Ktedonobacterales bacterium]